MTGQPGQTGAVMSAERTRWERLHPIRAGRLRRCIAAGTHQPVIVDLGQRKVCLYLDNDQLAVLARSYGVEPPRMYQAGYAHANCAGGCFRAGHAAWRHLLRDSPDLFVWHEWREHNWRRRWGRNATVCRWRSGPLDGQPMTLQTLRRLVERGRPPRLSGARWTRRRSWMSRAAATVLGPVVRTRFGRASYDRHGTDA